MVWSSSTLVPFSLFSLLFLHPPSRCCVKEQSYACPQVPDQIHLPDFFSFKPSVNEMNDGLLSSLPSIVFFSVLCSRTPEGMFLSKRASFCILSVTSDSGFVPVAPPSFVRFFFFFSSFPASPLPYGLIALAYNFPPSCHTPFMRLIPHDIFFLSTYSYCSPAMLSTAYPIFPTLRVLSVLALCLV